MKTIKSILILLAFTTVINAQAPFEFFVRAGNDPNMILFGAHPESEGNAKGLHNKYGIGFEFENLRIGMDYEIFNEIGFTKWTYLYADYKLKNVIKNINLFGGLEISGITRHHPDFHYSQPDNYREYTTTPLLLGANGEIQYRKPNSFLAIGIQANIHRAESELQPYKNYRFQVFGNLYFYL